MAIFCQASGFKALERKLQALKTLTTNPRIDKALGQGTTKMQAQIKLLTPVDTGNLRDKIVWSHVKMMEYTIETNVEYAIFVEFGTGRLGDPAVPHTAKPYWTYYSEKLQHFVRTSGQEPAAMFRTGFELTYKEVFNMVRAEVHAVIRDA